ncbi:MAG: acyl carrier protein [Chitinivibrionales bacterium]|nr:acyl carrier protein [Chitinivibrionales bacterium]
MEELIGNLKKQIIETLNLSDVQPDDIDPDAPLIGDGLGLDSIDTLELLVLLEKEYGVTVADVNVGRKVFSSVRAIARYIEENKPQK